MSVTWITYKGKQILYADYRGLEGEAIVENLEAEVKVVLESSHRVLVLDNVTGNIASRKFMERAEAAGRTTESRTTKHAVVGITALKRILLEGYNRVTGGKMIPFATEREALEWLVTD